MTTSATVGDELTLGAVRRAHAAMLRQAAAERIKKEIRQLHPRAGSSCEEGPALEKIEKLIRQLHHRAAGSWGEEPEPEVIEMYGEIGGLGSVGKETGHARDVARVLNGDRIKQLAVDERE